MMKNDIQTTKVNPSYDLGQSNQCRDDKHQSSIEKNTSKTFRVKTCIVGQIDEENSSSIDSDQENLHLRNIQTIRGFMQSKRDIGDHSESNDESKISSVQINDRDV